MKSEDRSKAFEETQAYSDIWMELVMDEDAAAEFVNGIVPKNLKKKMDANQTE